MDAHEPVVSVSPDGGTWSASGSFDQWGGGSTRGDDVCTPLDLCDHHRVLLNLIAELESAEHGQIIDRGRIIDHLLDLRLAAEGDLGTTDAIDRLLANTPGKSTVETTWWKDTLAELRLGATPELTH